MGVVAAFAVPHPPLAIPQVGRGREAGIQHTLDAYREVARRICDLVPETVVVISSHATAYTDYIHISPGMSAQGSFADYRAPEVSYEVDYDIELVKRICQNAGAENIPCGTRGDRKPELDHGTLIPIHFLNEVYAANEYLMPLFVRVGISGLSPADHYRFGRLIARCADEMGRRVVVVASGDLSHRLLAEGPYGYDPAGPQFDSMVCGAFSSASFLSLLTVNQSMCERAGECGLRCFQIMAGTLDEVRVKPELLSYEGPFGVGYAVASFVPNSVGSDPSRDFLSIYESWYDAQVLKHRSAEDAYVALAREALENYVLTGMRISVPDNLPEELLERRAGCFVTIKKDGQLRGCIGTLAPARASLAAEICANAVAAGCNDPRFPGVAADELDDLVYDVDVLTEPEPCGLSDLDPKRYGVVVSTPDGRRGVLLPDLDGVDDVAEQVSIAARKGHISMGRDEVHYARFEVVRHW